MNKTILIVFCTLFVSLGYAQGPLGWEGNQFNLASGYTDSGIPIVASYEMGIHEDVSFGIEASMRFFNETLDATDYSHTILGFSFFSNYYFNTLLKMKHTKWALYSGVHLSYYKWISQKEYNEFANSSSTLAIGIQLGAKYYFHRNWGAFLEGIGNNDHLGGRIGVTYRL